MDTSPNTEEQVLLVNERDEAMGTMGKLQAHREAALHRAFSVFLFDDEGRLLMQKRVPDKYHSGGLWTNTCCSHPRPDETVQDAAQRRLVEEMGIDTPLEYRFSFLYKASVGNGLLEHELDHVLFGRADGAPQPDPAEVQDWRYIGMDELRKEMDSGPERFTAWLHHCWPMLMEELQEKRA